MALPHSIVTIYKEWANSVLCEAGLSITSITQLGAGSLLHTLYQQLRYCGEPRLHTDAKQLSNGAALSNILSDLESTGIKHHSASIPEGTDRITDIHCLLDLLWTFILHFTIFSPFDENPVKLSQHTYSIGTKLLLQWSNQILNGAAFNYRESFVQNMEKDILHNIINQVTGLLNSPDQPETGDYREAVAEADRKLGVGSNLLRACDVSTEDLAVTVYVSLLRRKRELILSGKPATRPSVLVDHLKQPGHQASLECARQQNEKTKAVLQDIEDQLASFKKSTTDDNISSTRELPAVDLDDVMAGEATSQSEVPPTSTGSVSSLDQLKIDLSAIINRYNEREDSRSSTPLAATHEAKERMKSTEFTELLTRFKRESRRVDSDYRSDTPPANIDIREIYDDLDRTSPKSHPTDEGFGTYTKTTPRGKSDSEHTDCEQELPADCEAEPAEDHQPMSITDWWEQVKLPDTHHLNDELLALSQADPQANKTLTEDGNQVVSRSPGELNSHEFDEDELMCMLDSIGIQTIKSTATLRTAHNAELRLMHILKERDDLVLSYHSSLEELSRLTARISDENQLLREQLNMADSAHDNLFMALGGEASSGRQIAMQLQGDLSDTQLNVVTRLREDKRVLQDRLAALEQDYNCEIKKWQAEKRAHNDALEKIQEELEELDHMGSVDRENQMLKLQLEELRNMLDVSVSRTQDECTGYLATIDKLKSQLEANTNEELGKLHEQHANTTRSLEAAIEKLQTENQQLRNALDDMNATIHKLKNIPTESKSVGVDLDSPKAAEREYIIEDLKEQMKDLSSRLEEYQQENLQTNQRLQDELSNKLSLRGTIAELEGQIKIQQQKYNTVEAVHNLALSQNDDVMAKLKQLQSDHSSMRLVYEREVSTLEQKNRLDNSSLNAELEVTRKQCDNLRAENEKYKQVELNLNSEINRLISDRGNVQTELNRARSEIMTLHNETAADNLKITTLERTVTTLETQTAEFKRQALELVERLEEVQREKDDIHRQLNGLKSEIESGIHQWQQQASEQQMSDQQTIRSLESRLEACERENQLIRESNDELSRNKQRLEDEIVNVTRQGESQRQLVAALRSTAGLSDEESGYALKEKFEQLEKQNMEYKFTTSHFRSENNQLQLRVNQLEELNKLTEERNKILQKELDVVQSSLNDTVSSHDSTNVNLLDMSMSDLTSNNDVSDLKTIIQAAKKQVEHLQKKRQTANLDYSRKISSMERLIRDRSPVPSSVTVIPPSPSVPATPQKSSVSQRSATLQPGELTGIHNIANLHANYIPLRTDLLSRAPPRSQSVPVNPTTPRRLLGDVPDSLHLRVEELTGGLNGVKPYDLRPASLKPVSTTSSRDFTTANLQNDSGSGLNEELQSLTNIEDENAALKAEMEKINRDRASLRQQMQEQTSQHDLLNSTLEELERSLDEVAGGGRLLRESLIEANEAIQTNLLHQHRDSTPRVSTPKLQSVLQQSSYPLFRPQSTANQSATPRSAYTTPTYQSSTPRSAYSTPLGVSQPIKAHSLTNHPVRSTSSSTPKAGYHSGTFEDSPGSFDRLTGWMAGAERDMTSSHNYNKLQQTNVTNYDQLLNSADNSKSPAAMTSSKTRDLNKMIQHSLSQLTELRGAAGVTPSAGLHHNITSTPVEDRDPTTGLYY